MSKSLYAVFLLATATPALAQTVSDPAAVPVSQAALPDFPYITVPAGHIAQNANTLPLEEKYVFPGGKTRVVEGPYYSADLFIDGGTWSETLLLREIEGQVKKLGGVRVFDGPMPQSARKMIDENQPRFVKDLYDPAPYRFRQYLVKTPDKLIWVELGYGYNADMVDLTVVDQAAAK